MKKILLTLLCFTSQVAHAEFLKKCTDIVNVSGASATTTSSIVQLNPLGDPSVYDKKAVTAIFEGANVSGTTPTLDVKIQSCETPLAATCGDTPFVAVTCTTGTCYSAYAGNKYSLDANQDTVNVWPFFRVVYTLGGTSPVYNLKVRICTN